MSSFIHPVPCQHTLCQEKQKGLRLSRAEAPNKNQLDSHPVPLQTREGSITPPGSHTELRGRRQRILRGRRQCVTSSGEGCKAKHNGNCLHHFFSFLSFFPCRKSGCGILLLFLEMSTPKTRIFPNKIKFSERILSSRCKRAARTRYTTGANTQQKAPLQRHDFCITSINNRLVRFLPTC